MYLLIELFLCVLFAITPWIIDKNKKTDKKFKIAVSIIIFIGCLVRLIFIEKYPLGFNQDEASIGYEAYSILNYGIDRNGATFPVHLNAWGSGQNALYAYLIMPFIWCFGNTEFAVRLPMAIIGCISLLLLFIIGRKIFDNKRLILMLILFSIIPWHILKSRWGLESNLFPDLILWSILFIYLSVIKNEKKYFIIASIILGISTYSYGTSYLYVPIFIGLVCLFLILKKKITIKDSILYIAITGAVAIPMILFVIINYFKLNTITFLNITIPRLDFNRFTAITSVNGNFISNCFNNLKNSLDIMIYQSDSSILNYISKYGIFYSFSLPFIILGMVYTIKNKNTFMEIVNIAFISGIFIAAFTIPNINRINIIWLPIILDLVYGLIVIYDNNKSIANVIICLYLAFFIGLTNDYFKSYQDNIGNTAFYGLGDSIKYVEKMDYDKLYIDNSVNQPYIFYLFYTKYSPNKYIKNRVIPKKKVMFQTVKSIGNVYFSLPKKLNKENDNAYIISNDTLSNYELEDDFEIKTFNNYSVVSKKK